MVVQDSREFRYAIDANDRILSANSHWFDFAKENGISHLSPETLHGRSLWEFISGAETRQLYYTLLKNVRDRGTEKTVPYRCDGPDRRRSMELTMSHISGGGVLFRSRVIHEEEREPVTLLQLNVLRNDQLLIMCSWCNKVRVREVAWLEVEDAVKELALFDALHLPRLSHGICDVCVGQFDGYGI